ncbi:hypothetical protein [Streptomyces sp. NPDC048277]|uniref:hypothetical protein n=1 Tax=Streptomyces sp. NPDC048277 TaxID=3155027 RepID=UPI003404684A
MEKRLEAGWFQRIAWAALAWGSLGLLVWVPFLYAAIRRGRGSDWGAFASFALYEAVVLSWQDVTDGNGDAVLGAVFVLTMLIATGMLLFALFDKRLPNPQGQVHGQAYGAMAPPPVPGNPYLR